MVRYVMLLNFTDAGASRVGDSPSRADDFRAQAAKLGVTIEAQYWLTGAFDGLVTVTAASEAVVSALALQLSRRGYVRTTLSRAYDEKEFQGLLAQG